MQNGSCYTLIISDLHLGSETSRAADALRALKSISFNQLILLGDIFCDLDFARLKKDHWRFLSYIRKLSNPKRGIKVVWVEGNHDRGLSRVLSHLVGVKVYQEYMWEYGGKRHLAIHGHQFDRFLVRNAVLSTLGSFIYLALQKLDSRRLRLVRLLDKLSTSWLRLSPNVREGAFARAKARGAHVVCCGHTHLALEAEQDGIRYYNSGSWTGARATYLTVDEEGVHIHEYAERTDHRDTGEERSDVAAEVAALVGATGLSGDVVHQSARC
ncbi:MAG: UDP-2,3-diacylglucosamine diphosphatase [Acidobacteriales bacterium]|nr:UDP-2,3-diacylglucosamine diphosphatase [Terriglobales bacterium]